MDDLNRPVSDTLPSGIEVDRVFNSISQLTSLVNKNNQSQTLSSFGYSYDSAGRQTQKIEDTAILTASGPAMKSLQSGYSYDTINRLVGVNSPQETFNYDAVGNRLYTGGSINDANYLLSDGYKYTFTYSLNGEMTGRTNTLTGDKTEYFWNGLSQLISLRLKNSSNVVKKEIYYVYDGLGRRIKRQVVNYVTPSQSYTRNLYYDRDQIVEERDENNQVIARYMNGVGIDDPLLLIKPNGVYAYTKDGLGSVKEIVKLNDQVPHQRYSYSSYGMTSEALEVITPDKRPIENRYAYTGREIESETGLYYYRARYYDPELGRFISEDPIGFLGGEMNLLNYVGSNPVNYVDPSGLKIAYSDSESRSLLQPLVEQLMESPAGAALVNQLESSNAVYTLNAVSGGPSSPGNALVPIFPGANGMVNINVCPNVEIDTTKGVKLATPLRILAHELGHLTGTRDDGRGRMNNINRYENPIMTPIDGLIRTSY